MNAFRLAALVAGFAALAHAQVPGVSPQLSGIAFLVGAWSSGRGAVAETGGTATGTSQITVAAAGAALLRQDQTTLFDKSGKPAGGFAQIMMIYPAAGTLHADYFDGTHAIHYVHAEIVPGKSVTFLSAPDPGVPTFRLAYALRRPGELSVAFSMAPPGAAFRPIATGTLIKS